MLAFGVSVAGTTHAGAGSMRKLNPALEICLDVFGARCAAPAEAFGCARAAPESAIAETHSRSHWGALVKRLLSSGHPLQPIV